MNQDGRVRAFMHDIAERAARNGSLAIVTVWIEDAPRAFLIGIEHDGTFNFLKTSFDPAYAALGPGRVAVNRALEEAFARKLRRFDFLGASDPYKARYTEDRRPHSTIFVYGEGVVSELRRAVKRRIAPLARRVLRREAARPVVMDR
jgi:CelD/BcsL family acetyltransferase involved in cellulose biosynthesis